MHKRYRKKTIIISDFFTKDQQKTIAEIIDYNYSLSKHKFLITNPQLDLKTLAGVIQFIFRLGTYIIITETADKIYVQASSKQPA